MTDTRLPARLVESGDDWPATLEEAAREELMILWSDLGDARREAVKGGWSIRCENVASRIVALTRHVGATPWDEVDADIVSAGIYERIHAEAGLEHPPIDRDRLAWCLAEIAERSRPLVEP